ncbi:MULTISPECIES: SGNH/GDSL hydrolase family protein [unclassified Lentimicrobium]|uniref:SGNH/GDSL hydrolase family protein n=1 Tax=unclassified Lentimicrobium TaxID=2677434 RepID=UPI001556B669|nr:MULTISPECIES: SGNH/GDSL hydrolase family protein [unclassified Lentimicrobium]NPD45364.1 SGNH/GDSL hydrolase family protein [Lentimicrobium sp. S6]NPD85269.1 SGNH/GDSL hydrolase family protein [Lentimicrobium sp. L6]
MKPQTKYILAAPLVLPILPIIYIQGEIIKRTVPRLPEATGIEGNVKVNSDKSLRLLCIGESSMAGVGAETHEEAIGGTIAKEISSRLNTNVYWRVYARNGYTAKRVRFKILPKITERNFDIIVIALGANDSFAMNSPKTWRENIIALLKDTQALFPNTPIVFMNMPPIKEFPAFSRLIRFSVGNLVDMLGKELDETIKSFDDVYFSQELITVESWKKKYQVEGKASEFFSDGVHPSKFTYQVWAKDVVDFIIEKKILK